MNILQKSLTVIVALLILQGCNSENSKESTTETEQHSEKRIAKNLISKREYILRGVEGEVIKVTKEGNRFKIDTDAPLVLFDFFATWCPACRAVAPHLANLQAKYPKEIKVVGVLIEENKNDQDVIDFKEQFNANYMIANSTSKNDKFANFKFSNEIASLLRQPRSFPIPLLVLLKNGEYFTHYVGAVPEEMIDSDIKEALGLRGKK